MLYKVISTSPITIHILNEESTKSSSYIPYRLISWMYCMTGSLTWCFYIGRVIVVFLYLCSVVSTCFNFFPQFLAPRHDPFFSKKSHLIPPEDIWLQFFRLEVGKSYFDTLPVDVRDEDVTYSSARLCQEKNENCDDKKSCSVFKVAFPTLVKERMTPVKPASPSSLCDRDKRDIHYSDDITDEDLQLYMQTLHLHPRLKRSVAIKQIPKENATRYCATRISETELGKLCAKIGVNVQQLVDTCSADVEVSQLL